MKAHTVVGRGEKSLLVLLVLVAWVTSREGEKQQTQWGDNNVDGMNKNFTPGISSICRPRWSNGYPRILLLAALVLDFDSHRGEILTLFAKKAKTKRINC